MSGLKDIKSSLRGAKLPNGQPMLLDEEQNSLALLIEQVSTAALQHCSTAAPPLQARHELNCGDPRKAECYMSQADTINDQEPLVKIVRGVCKVRREGEIRAANYPSVSPGRGLLRDRENRWIVGSSIGGRGLS